MQFLVPQFSETEDKIVGFMTLRQFLIVGAGAGAIIILFFILVLWLWLLLALAIGSFTIAFAFLKINGRPFARIFIAALNYYWKPQIYAWQTENPMLKKDVDTMAQFAGGMSLESIVSGLALKHAWQKVQMGGGPAPVKPTQRDSQTFQIFRGLRGEKEVAKRVDYF